MHGPASSIAIVSYVASEGEGERVSSMGWNETFMWCQCDISLSDDRVLQTSSETTNGFTEHVCRDWGFSEAGENCKTNKQYPKRTDLAFLENIERF